MPRWSKADYGAYQSRRAASGPRSIIQESQADRQAEPLHRSGDQSVDGSMCGQFRVAITLFISDARDRDPDGAASTLLDCFLDAAGRLLLLDRRAVRKMAKREQRRRGGERGH
jgi:hypothetical protein